MQTLSIAALVLIGGLGLVGCGGTDHRLLGNTQGAATYAAPPPGVITAPPRACRYGPC